MYVFCGSLVAGLPDYFTGMVRVVMWGMCERGFTPRIGSR